MHLERGPKVISIETFNHGIEQREVVDFLGQTLDGKALVELADSQEYPRLRMRRDNHHPHTDVTRWKGRLQRCAQHNAAWF